MASDRAHQESDTTPAVPGRSRGLATARHAIPFLAVVVGGYVLLAPFADPRSLALAVHYLGMGLLFLFLTFGELCCLRIAWRSRRAPPWSAILRTAAWWRGSTETLPAPAAILILFSGLRLLLEGGHSLRSPWLFVLVSGFGFLMGDGIFGYTRDVRTLHRLVLHAGPGGPTHALRRFLRHPGFHGMRLLHYVSLPILFVVGHTKVPRHLPLLHEPIAAIEEWLLPLAGPRTAVVMAVLLVGFEVFLIGLLRRKGHHGR